MPASAAGGPISALPGIPTSCDRPDRGVGVPAVRRPAAHRLVALLHALTGTPLDAGTEHFQASSLQVTTIDIGNPATNVVPGIARATFNIRFNDLWSSGTLKEWVADKLAAVGGGIQLA